MNYAFKLGGGRRSVWCENQAPATCYTHTMPSHEAHLALSDLSLTLAFLLASCVCQMIGWNELTMKFSRVEKKRCWFQVKRKVDKKHIKLIVERKSFWSTKCKIFYIVVSVWVIELSNGSHKSNVFHFKVGFHGNHKCNFLFEVENCIIFYRFVISTNDMFRASSNFNNFHRKTEGYSHSSINLWTDTEDEKN